MRFRMSKTIRIIFLLSIITSIVFCRCDNRHSFVLFVYILMIGCHLDVENQKLASFLQGLWLLCQPLVMASFDITSSSVALGWHHPPKILPSPSPIGASSHRRIFQPLFLLLLLFVPIIYDCQFEDVGFSAATRERLPWRRTRTSS